MMVPVPEELVDQVKNYVAWNLSGPKFAEHPDAVARVLEEADEKLRTMIFYVARTVADDDRVPSLMEVAEATDLAPREVMGCMGDLGERLFAAGRRLPLLLPRPATDERPEGVSAYAHRLVHMSAADAELVLGL